MPRILAATAIALLIAAPAIADDPSWLGKQVMPKANGITFGERSADGTLTPVKMRQVLYTVLREEDGWIRLRWPGQEGWAIKSEWVLLEDAPVHFTAAIRADPASVSAWTMRGAAWRARGELDNAVKDFTEAIRLHPNAVGYSNRGLARLDKKDYDEAIADFTEALRLDAKLVTAMQSRGSAFSEKNEHDKAIADHNEAIRLDPSNAGAYFNRGISRVRQGEYDAAINDYTDAIRLDPSYAPAFDGRGRIHQAKKEYDKAIADYTEAIRLDPKSGSGYITRGTARWLNKEYAGTLSDYTDAIRLDPKNAGSLNDKASLLATCPDDKVRDGKQALELALQACELSKWKVPLYVSTLAEAYAEVGDFEKAVKYQKQAMEDKDFPNNQQDGARKRLAAFEQKKPWREE